MWTRRVLAKRRGCSGLALASGLGVLTLTVGARAIDSRDARDDAARQVQSVRAEVSALGSDSRARRRATHSTEQLLAAGDMSLRSKDYEQAIDTLNQVVELHRQGKASANAHADGLFLLAEAYFGAGQWLSAGHQYLELVDLGDRAPYDSYAGRSLARLVDVAMREGRPDVLDAIAARAAQLSQPDPSGSLDYGRGKLNFARGRFDDAERYLRAVPESSALHHQALYLLGTVSLKRRLGDLQLGAVADAGSRLAVDGALERLSPVIAQFHAVTELAKDTPEHREVIDAAWLAIGRLNYESDNYLDAAQAYIQVGQGAPAYPEMLFELAWVYVRMGDYERAERALELLSAVAPDTLDVADGALLRADLMLRSGRFERALTAYEEVRTRFDAARERVDKFLATTRDPALYYDRLIEEGLAIGGASALPQVVLDWVREEARSERVFNVIDDVTRARDVLRRARQLASKLNAVLSAASRAKAFPGLEASLTKVIALQNQLCQARRTLALGFDDVDGGELSGELAEVRRERRELMEQVAAVPVSTADFQRREDEGERTWNEVSQALQRATLETDKLQAVVNGLEQVLDQPEKHGVTKNAASRARFQAQVEANEQALNAYRTQIEAYRQQVENGRVQVGLGDRRYAEDAVVRRRFRQLQTREVELLSARRGGNASLDYARAVAPQLAEITALEQRLDGAMAALESEVSSGSEELRRLVAEESERIAAYAQQLDELDQHARLLVGEVAMKNFASVRERLRGIVLRADVGIVQQAWELREEQQVRLRGLQRQRALEEKNLEDELREVSDDAGEGP
jgi:tetratricopeptide (TPR) repeat protein